MIKKPLRMSNSRLDLYEQCPKKYDFRYNQNLKGNYTASPLLFGSAIDAALNYILESLRDKVEWDYDKARDIFFQKMKEWTSEKNRLDFFKGDVPDELKDSIDEEDPLFQIKVWNEMVNRGLECIDTYINDILPELKQVISVQDKEIITNEAGDEFIVILDFIAELNDGRIVLLDNKTASTKYPKNKVVTSQQLSLYINQFPDLIYAGYCVLIKDPNREKGLKFQIMVDKIPQETIDDAYERLDKALHGIKAGEFPRNFKACKMYNKPCEFLKICKYGQDPDLISNREEKQDGTKK